MLPTTACCRAYALTHQPASRSNIWSTWLSTCQSWSFLTRREGPPPPKGPHTLTQLWWGQRGSVALATRSVSSSGACPPHLAGATRGWERGMLALGLHRRCMTRTPPPVVKQCSTGSPTLPRYLPTYLPRYLPTVYLVEAGTGRHRQAQGRPMPRPHTRPTARGAVLVGSIAYLYS